MNLLGQYTLLSYYLFSFFQLQWAYQLNLINVYSWLVCLEFDMVIIIWFYHLSLHRGHRCGTPKRIYAKCIISNVIPIIVSENIYFLIYRPFYLSYSTMITMEIPTLTSFGLLQWSNLLVNLNLSDRFFISINALCQFFSDYFLLCRANQVL